MTIPFVPAEAQFSLDALQRIDDVSARFEAAWAAGETPLIEEYLQAFQEPERSALFRELLLSELELRKQRHALLDEAAYHTRFPPYGDLIRTLFRETEKSGPGDPIRLDFLQPSTRPDALGRLGPFEVLEILGQGGFGIVLRAFDDVLQRVVAIKVLSPQAATAPMAHKRFLREVRSVAAIHHDNVVAIYAIAEQPIPHLIMEYVAGETLQQRLERTGPLDVRQVVGLGQQIASGLAAAHAQGLTHRDLKPANILLEHGGHVGNGPGEADTLVMGPTGRAKIADFGMARSAADAHLTASGVIAGTPLYMAPEQAEGSGVDHRADLFSLGSVLYAMCTGQPPFPAATAVAVLRRVVDDAPRPIREISPLVPQWLIDVIGKLHAKKPALRFQTAAEVADLLGRHLAELTSQGTVREGSTKGAGHPPTMLPQQDNKTLDAPGGVTRKQGPRPRVRLVLTAAAALGLVGALLAYLGADANQVARLWKNLIEPSGKQGPPPGPPVFVILASAGWAEQAHATLTEAVAAAPSGATVEIRDHGPFACERLVLVQKALCLRAGTGWRPVLRFAPNDDRLPRIVLTRAVLVLEGLELNFPHGGRPSRELIAADGSLCVAHCRFVAETQGDVIAGNPSRLELLHSHLHAPGGHCLVPQTGVKCAVLIDNCLLTGVGQEPLLLEVRPRAEELTVRLRNTTLVSDYCYSIRFVDPGKLQALRPATPPLRVQASGNVFAAQFRPVNVDWRSGKPTFETVKDLLRGQVRWSDEGNLYGRSKLLLFGGLNFYEDEQFDAVDGLFRQLQDWQQLWGPVALTATAGRLAFQGSDLFARLRDEPRQLQLTDFRLAPDSAGKGCAPGGKDLGADVGLIGFGEAHERWQQTAAYQAWRKQTDELLTGR